MNAKPLELMWLLNEVGMLAERMINILEELSSKVELVAASRTT
jgi:hypothetical protein